MCNIDGTDNHNLACSGCNIEITYNLVESNKVATCSASASLSIIVCEIAFYSVEPSKKMSTQFGHCKKLPRPQPYFTIPSLTQDQMLSINYVH